MKTLINVILLALIALGISKTVIDWIDQSFIENYAYSAGISPADVRIADDESKCSNSEWFDDRYGLCVLDHSDLTMETKLFEKRLVK